MEIKNVRKLKTVLTIAAVCLFLFGWTGFLICCLNSMSSAGIKKYYKQHPLNEKNGVAVDSQGNIYIGETETGSIQVYDSKGCFQYGFNFPTGWAGWFAFGIDQDKIHVVTCRTKSYFVFDRGELVYSEERIDDTRSEELQAKYHMTEDNLFVLNGKTYKTMLFNNVSIEDKLNGQVEKVHLNAPIWPFSAKIFFLMLICGVGLILILHHKYFISICNN